MALSVQRKSIFPIEGDDWQTIAERELGDQSAEQAIASLQSWNLHVFMRRVTGKDTYHRTSEILPSDVIFLEPPVAK